MRERHTKKILSNITFLDQDYLKQARMYDYYIPSQLPSLCIFILLLKNDSEWHLIPKSTGISATYLFLMIIFAFPPRKVYYNIIRAIQRFSLSFLFLSLIRKQMYFLFRDRLLDFPCWKYTGKYKYKNSLGILLF